MNIHTDICITRYSYCTIYELKSWCGSRSTGGMQDRIQRVVTLIKRTYLDKESVLGVSGGMLLRHVERIKAPEGRFDILIGVHLLRKTQRKPQRKRDIACPFKRNKTSCLRHTTKLEEIQTPRQMQVLCLGIHNVIYTYIYEGEMLCIE